ncbi:MAG: CtsR family transcriptional regulator [Lactobacillaceae bacterium]|jgi:transcriptional regulator CtsR|nr:CtsR family transcriptional regulator [Lactobacillaceae bacterium]
MKKENMSENNTNNNNNVSDLIEQYLKDILLEDDSIEIKRSDVAELFSVVPSQINYVINTRFNLQNGYIIESKRGGGGYIRIERVHFSQAQQVFDDLIDVIGDSIGQPNANQIIQALYEDDVITLREAKIMISSISKDTLRIADKVVENTVRARILVGMINRLRYEEGQ